MAIQYLSIAEISPRMMEMRSDQARFSPWRGRGSGPLSVQPSEAKQSKVKHLARVSARLSGATQHPLSAQPIGASDQEFVDVTDGFAAPTAQERKARGKAESASEALAVRISSEKISSEKSEKMPIQNHDRQISVSANPYA
jgi:hypothetical protein